MYLHGCIQLDFFESTQDLGDPQETLEPAGKSRGPSGTLGNFREHLGNFRNALLGCSRTPEKSNYFFRGSSCDTTGTSAVGCSRHVCCVTQNTCLRCDTADMSAV